MSLPIGIAATWRPESIGRVCTVIDCKHVTAPFGSQGYPVVSIGEVGERFINLRSAPRTTAQFYTLLTQGGRKPLPGDLIMTRNATVGRISRVSNFHPPFAMGQDVCLLRPNPTVVVPEFMQVALRSPEVSRQIEAAMAGSTFKRLNVQQIKQLRVPMPSREEQTRIAGVISDVEDLIAALERLIVKKQAIKQGMTQQLLTGRTRLPGFDVAWTEVALGDVARFSKGSGLPKSALTSSGSTPCIHYGELFTFYGPEIHNVASRTNPTGRMVASEDLDVLMPTSDVTPRGLAKASAIHGRGVVLGGDVLIIRPEKKRAYGPFLAHAIRRDADQVLQLVRGSTVYHLYASDMRNFTLSIPSVEEQQAIADVLLDAEREIDSLDSRLVKARDLKTGMMQQLLTGRTRLPVETAS